MRIFWQQNKYHIISLVGLFLVATIPFATHYPYNWDAAQFVLGVEHFSVAMHQPHPPGYPLFIATGKVLSFFMSPHTALLSISMSFALLATLLLYILIYRLWKQRWLALVVAVAWLLNPAFWLYRETALTYTIDACTVIALLLFSHLLFKTRKSVYVYFSVTALALLGGFRPSLIVLLAPMIILQWGYLKSWKTIGLSALLAITICLTWYIPLVISAGGIESYQTVAQAQYVESASTTSVFYGAGWAKTFEQIKFVLITLLVSWNVMLLPMGLSIYIWLYKRFRGKRIINGWYLALGGAALIGPMFIYGFIHIGQIGYIIIMLPLGYVCAAYGIQWIWTLAIKPLRWVSLFLVGAVIVLHAMVFLFMVPAYTHPEFFPTRRIELWFQHTARWAPQLFKLNATILSQTDKRTGNLVSAIKAYAPDEILVIAGRNITYPASNGLPIRNDELFRELSATLPAYQVIQIAPDNTAVLSAQHYIMESLTKPSLVVSDNIKYVFIALDKIPPKGMPNGLNIKIHDLPGEQHYYIGEMNTPFTFYEITVKHQSAIPQ